MKKYIEKLIIKIIEKYLCPENYLSFKSWIEYNENRIKRLEEKQKK